MKFDRRIHVLVYSGYAANFYYIRERGDRCGLCKKMFQLNLLNAFVHSWCVHTLRTKKNQKRNRDQV